MRKLYQYYGTVSTVSCVGGKVQNITLYNSQNDDIAPTRLDVYGALARYIYEIEMTDAEERYLLANYFFDSNLVLRRIEIPSSDKHVPAKIISQADFLSEEIAIFGPQDYIETDNPEPMSRDQVKAWYEFKVKELCD